ncbi:MAG: DUF1501 domain-containing protein, partial [Planctomycetaceae bacterium]
MFPRGLLAPRSGCNPGLSRREALEQLGAGFGTLALGSLLTTATPAAPVLSATPAGSPLAPRAPHFAPRAKRVIQLFMPGGPSQVDTFDHKPAIARFAGQRPAEVDRKSLRNTKGGLFPSPFKFQQYGQTGKWVSDIFPHVGALADELCFVHSLH